jgi:hypothetical protein
VVLYDADWWIKRIAIASGALTVSGLIWRPVTRWLQGRFDERVTQALRRCKAEVRVIMREDVFPAEFANSAATRALAESNEDRLEAMDAIVKAQGVALLDIPKIAGQMEGLPAAIQSLTLTMMAIHKEVGEIRGEMKTWDGSERRIRIRRDGEEDKKDPDPNTGD